MKILLDNLPYTANELADKLGVSAVTISNWKRGFSTPPKRKLIKVIELAEVENKKQAELLTFLKTHYNITLPQQ